MTTLLDPGFQAQLEQLRLQAGRRLLGRFGGEHRSTRFGNTVDFADFREYRPGDDFRRIDYHVLARLDQVLVKLFESDDEITVRLVIDTSASMAVGGKLSQALRVAAALGFVALAGHDVVTVHAFPGGGPVRRFAGRAALPALLDHLESLAAGGPTPIAAATRDVLARPGPPGMVVVLSDLYTPDWRNLMSLRTRGSELIVCHTLAPEDLDPDLSGDVELHELEDGERLTVSMTDDLAGRYRQAVVDWRAEIAAVIRGGGGVYIELLSTDDVREVLVGRWRQVGVLR